LARNQKPRNDKLKVDGRAKKEGQQHQCCKKNYTYFNYMENLTFHPGINREKSTKAADSGRGKSIDSKSAKPKPPRPQSKSGNSATNYEKKRKNDEIFERLYSDAGLKIQRNIDAGDQYYDHVCNRSEPYETHKKNTKIIDSLRMKRFEKIFTYLDDDKDGLINSKNINLEILNVELLEILAPMLFEIEDFTLTLSTEEFKKACSHLYENLEYTEKAR
jgi:hypothetical protein